MRACCVATVLLALVSSAQAGLMTLSFTGTVTGVNGAPGGVATTVGSPVIGSITYDTSTADTDPSTDGGTYLHSLVDGVSFTISGKTITDSSYEMDVLNLTGSIDDIFQEAGDGSAAAVDGVPAAKLLTAFLLETSVNDVFSSASLPTTLPPLSSFETAVGSIVVKGGTKKDTLFIEWQIDTLSLDAIGVPEPTSGVLLAFGCIGVLGGTLIVRRRPSRDCSPKQE